MLRQENQTEHRDRDRRMLRQENQTEDRDRDKDAEIRKPNRT
jgi:hypothetical protein